jgi:hypothetical protein
LQGTPIPTGSLALAGIMSQYQSSYQLLPRDLNDIVLSGNPPVLSSVLFQFNITPSSFDVSFNTLNSGNSIIYYGTTTELGSVASDATDDNHSPAFADGINCCNIVLRESSVGEQHR